ncbi:MAG: hypothetical protein R3Y04_09475, partial [Rikenellaceae bacterium]
GAKGEDGASAYQIAVANGFEGTEAEWLESLDGGNSTAWVRGSLYLATTSTISTALNYYLGGDVNISKIISCIDNLGVIMLNNPIENDVTVSAIEYVTYNWSETSRKVGFKIPLASANNLREVRVDMTDISNLSVYGVEDSVLAISKTSELINDSNFVNSTEIDLKFDDFLESTNDANVLLNISKDDFSISSNDNFVGDFTYLALKSWERTGNKFTISSVDNPFGSLMRLYVNSLIGSATLNITVTASAPNSGTSAMSSQEASILAFGELDWQLSGGSDLSFQNASCYYFDYSNYTYNFSIPYNISTGSHFIDILYIEREDGIFLGERVIEISCDLVPDSVEIDTTPKKDSTNLVTSGGVYDSLDSLRNVPLFYFGSDTPTIPTDPVAELPDGWSLSNTITEESGVSQIVTTSTTLSMALYNEADSTYKFGDVFSIVSSGEGSSCCEMTQILDGDTSITLSDNTEYIFTTELEALSIDLPDDWGYCQARIKFATADSITTISISDDMMWSGGETPIIEANEQYELLISGNIVAIIGTGWALNNPEFIKMWNLRCNLAGQYNPISKKFELLNTTYSYDIDSKTFSTAIMELTQEEALDCWAQTAHLTPSAYALNRVTCKTNIPFAQARINRGGNDALDCHGASEGNTMSYIYFNPTTKNDTIYKQSGWHERSGISMFNTNAGGSVSSTVTEIIGILRMNFTSTQGTMHCGINCEKVWIYYTGTTGFTINSNCVNISRESMRFLFDNAAQTGDQTITIPQAVYDRLTEEDKEVAIDKGITLATN